MSEPPPPAEWPQPERAPEALRRALTAERAGLAAVEPVLAHLPTARASGYLSDAIMARIAALGEALAVQLTQACRCDPTDGARHALATALAADRELTAHGHALALEIAIGLRLARERQIDPVLPPLLRARLAGRGDAVAHTAKAVLDAQSRFAAPGGRMGLSLADLPRPLLDRVLAIWREVGAAQALPPVWIAAAYDGVLSDYDENATRPALLHLLLTRMDAPAHVLLDVDRAGVALFLTALAHHAGMGRDAAVRAVASVQGARLALALRGAGLDRSRIESAREAFHGEGADVWASAPDLHALTPREAREILSEADAAAIGREGIS